MTKSTSIARFDELIHAPLRLRICASLAPVDWTEFTHLKHLSDAGYVQVERFTKPGRSHMRVSLTTSGRRAYVGHVAALQEITVGK